MYRDNTLIPSEAVRLLALGILATRETTYAALAGEVRDFTGHVVGPSLELVAAPIELLKIEGLVEPVDEAESEDLETLRITEAGRAELTRLLNSNMRPPVTDINKLIITIKMRFLHLLERHEQALQAEMMAEMCERQLVRLTNLRGGHGGDDGNLVPWLDHEIEQTRERLAWFLALQDRLSP